VEKSRMRRFLAGVWVRKKPFGKRTVPWEAGSNETSKHRLESDGVGLNGGKEGGLPFLGDRQS